MKNPFQKRIWIRLGVTLLVLLLGLAALSIQSRPVRVQPTLLPPTYTPEPTPTLETEVERAVLEALFPYLKEPTYQTDEDSRWLLATAVSSGVFSSTQVSLASGVEVDLDLLSAYGVMRPGKVLEVPVVIGIQAPDQPYAYFSDLYFYHHLYPSPSPTFPTRGEALEDARRRLPRGRIFLLIAEFGASTAGQDWEACSGYMRDFRRYPPEICQVGKAIEQAHPGLQAAFIQKSATSLPDSWLLAGWFFQELDPRENPPLQTDISLPPIP